MSNNQESSTPTIDVPFTLHKIQNGTGGECWVTLSSPDQPLDTPLSEGDLPLFDTGHGDLAITSGNTVYACNRNSVYKAGSTDPIWSSEDTSAKFKSMCQIEDILFMASAEGSEGEGQGQGIGVYYYNPANGANGQIISDRAVSSVAEVNGVLYFCSEGTVSSFVFTSLEAGLGQINLDPSIGFSTAATVKLMGAQDSLFIAVCESGDTIIQQVDVNTQSVVMEKDVAVTGGNGVSSLAGATCIYSYHNNQDRSNHFLYLLTDEGQLYAAYPETDGCWSTQVATAYTQQAIGSSPYDSTGLGNETYLYGLAKNGENAFADQINPAVHVPICMAVQSNDHALTTVLPNNTFFIQQGSSANTTMTFQPVNGELQEAITVYHTGSTYTQDGTTYSAQIREILPPDNDQGIEYVAYEEEPAGGYEALMAVVQMDGGVVIIGEMDLDPVLGEAAHPSLHH